MINILKYKHKTSINKGGLGDVIIYGDKRNWVYTDVTSH